MVRPLVANGGLGSAREYGYDTFEFRDTYISIPRYIFEDRHWYKAHDVAKFINGTWSTKHMLQMIRDENKAELDYIKGTGCGRVMFVDLVGASIILGFDRI